MTIESKVKELLQGYNLPDEVIQSISELKATDGQEKPAVTKEQFNKMGYQERAKLYQENTDLYNQLIKE